MLLQLKNSPKGSPHVQAAYVPSTQQQLCCRNIRDTSMDGPLQKERQSDSQDSPPLSDPIEPSARLLMWLCSLPQIAAHQKTIPKVAHEGQQKAHPHPHNTRAVSLAPHRCSKLPGPTFMTASCGKYQVMHTQCGTRRHPRHSTDLGPTPQLSQTAKAKPGAGDTTARCTN
jgi:hypothetical protein